MLNLGERLLLLAAFLCALMAVVLVFELAVIGQPPRHCRYFVPVRHDPGIYSCSEYPRPVSAR